MGGLADLPSVHSVLSQDHDGAHDNSGTEERNNNHNYGSYSGVSGYSSTRERTAGGSGSLSWKPPTGNKFSTGLAGPKGTRKPFENVSGLFPLKVPKLPTLGLTLQPSPVGGGGNGNSVVSAVSKESSTGSGSRPAWL